MYSVRVTAYLYVAYLPSRDFTYLLGFQYYLHGFQHYVQGCPHGWYEPGVLIKTRKPRQPLRGPFLLEMGIDKVLIRRLEIAGKFWGRPRAVSGLGRKVKHRKSNIQYAPMLWCHFGVVWLWALSICCHLGVVWLTTTTRMISLTGQKVILESLHIILESLEIVFWKPCRQYF